MTHLDSQLFCDFNCNCLIPLLFLSLIEIFDQTALKQTNCCWILRRFVMFCIHCGNKLPDDAVFCNRCGQRQNVAADIRVPDNAILSSPSSPPSKEDAKRAWMYVLGGCIVLV